MAIITTLREKMGKFLVFVVGFSIIAFVLGDILGPNSSLNNQNRNIVGEINGEEIDLIQFNSVFELLSSNFSINNGRSPNNQEIASIRDQAWEKLINDISYNEQYQELGLTVTDKESVDMVQGDNIHPMILQAFTDPSNGSFSVDNVIGYLQNISNQPINQQQAWFSFEANLKPIRLRTKYDNLIGLTTNINSLQSKSEYFNSSDVIDLSYFFIPNYNISDTLFSVSENEMKSFLRTNQDDYKQEESRSISIVHFPLEPTKEDSSFYLSEMNNIKNQLLSGNVNDSTFALLNSDGFNPYMNFNIDELPIELENKEVGFVSDLAFKDGGMVIYKLSKIKNDQNFKARAKHILLKFNDQNKQDIRLEAQRILSLLRNGSDFDETARTYSEDGSASAGGDLGWFSEGVMVKPFQDAVFSRSRSGLIPRVIESEFGFHLIYVTQPKTKNTYSVVTILKQIVPSDNTRNNIFRDAEMFKIDALSSDLSFQELAEEMKYDLKTESNVGKFTNRVSNIQEDARSIVLWTYDDSRDKGDISDVIELNNSYVVTYLKEIKKEGTKNLDEVEVSIRKKILDNKKFDYMSAKMKDYSSLNELKNQFSEGQIYNMPSLDFNTNSLLNVGFAPEAVGVAFSMEQGELTQPIKIDDGIIVVNVNSIIKADTLNDYSDFGLTLMQANRFASSLKIDQAVKEFSNIEDFRYKFF